MKVRKLIALRQSSRHSLMAGGTSDESLGFQIPREREKPMGESKARVRLLSVVLSSS